MAQPDSYDYAIVGGGLQGGLIVSALAHRTPAPRIVVIEEQATLGGNHTWCFHDRDVPPDSDPWIEPLVSTRFDRHRVEFPDHSRTLEAGYSVVTSATFHRVVCDALEGIGGTLCTGQAAAAVSAHEVILKDGRSIRAAVVIDARGPDRDAGGRSGYQKFIGLEIETTAPHGQEDPILMDATVAQIDGYRFVYTLPLAANRILVEDTYFSDNPNLDKDQVTERIYDYCRDRKWQVGRVVRTEHGVLPMPWSGGPEPGSQAGVLIAGYRGGWFHPATGYSFPVAARLAALIGRLPADRLFGHDLAQLAHATRRQARYGRTLNRLLFRWFRPEERWHVLSRFYRLPMATIQRFYSLELTATNRARILVGRPPQGMSIASRLNHWRRAG